MVWVNMDRAAPSLHEWIAGMPSCCRARARRDEHAFAFAHEWEMDANWKVFQDNTIECYHCPTTHPELARALDMAPRAPGISDGRAATGSITRSRSATGTTKGSR